MSSHASREPVDILKKIGIVAALVAGLVQLNRFAVPPPGGMEPRGLLALGFVILAAYTIGELSEIIKLPHITGYLVAGLVLGPSMAHVLHDLLPAYPLPPPFDQGVLNDEVQRQFAPLDDLALALIALTAGGELKIEGLKQGIRQILGVAVGQVIVVGLAIVGLVWLISGPIPALALPQLEGMTTVQALSIGAVLASVSLATSPAATIAVINSTGAKGETTRTILSVVVLKDVVVVAGFAGAMALATGVLGQGGGETSFLMSLFHIFGSIVVGGLLGLLIHVYLRYVGTQLPLFLVFVVFATTFACKAWHLEAALVFIVAGFVTSNFSQFGHTLIEEVERLSLPVYVVFFTLAGAKLHLDLLWGIKEFAAALVLVRMVALVIGSRAGAQLTGGGKSLRRFGWMGFVSQAGLAITLATTVKGAFPGPVGEGLFSLLLGGVAVNEMLGPVMLQWGLVLAGDTPRDDDPAQSEPSEAAVTRAETDDDDPWGPPLETTVVEVDTALAQLEHETRALVDDLARGPLADREEELLGYVSRLRRDFLRVHRRAVAKVQSGVPLDDLPGAFRGASVALGALWRDQVLDRAAVARTERWNPTQLVEVLDGLVDSQPQSHSLPVLPHSLAPRDEVVLRRVLRSLLRLRVALGGRRDVDIRALVRYHLSGRAPGRIEGVVALLIDEEARLALGTTQLYAGIADSWSNAATLIETGEVDREALMLKLWALRREVDDDFEVLSQSVRNALGEGERRAGLILGHLMRDLKQDICDIGTPDLPHRKRRYGRVYSDRNAGVAALTSGLAGARRTLSARIAAVALDLELIGLEGRVGGAVETHGMQLELAFRDKGPTRLAQVETVLHAWTGQVEAELDAPEKTVGAMMEAVRGALGGPTEQFQAAIRAAEELHRSLAGDDAVAPLLRALIDAAHALTDYYTVPSRRVPDGDWSLPLEVPTVEVPFREIVLAWIESRVTRELADLSNGLAERGQVLLAALTDVDRVVAFNSELAISELEVLDPDEVMNDETRALLREMLIDPVRRSRVRLERLATEADAWPMEAHAGIREAVVGALDRLRSKVGAGDPSELRRMLLQEGEVRRRIARRAEDLTGLLPRTQAQLLVALVGALGIERVEQLSDRAGLPRGLLGEQPIREVLRPPGTRLTLPVVYRRLFSDRVLEAGDLVVGREREVDAAKVALTDAGRLGTVALVGQRGSGTTAVAVAVSRFWSGTLRRIDLEGPVTEAEVAAWFETEDESVLTLLSGLRWLYQLRPGGLAPLKRLRDELVSRETGGCWLITADVEVWHHVGSSVLSHVMGDIITLTSLSVADMTAAILGRHQMSAYELEFDIEEDLGSQVLNLVLRREETAARRQDAWFEALHEASGGIMHDALRLWMASIREVDDERGVIRIGAVPQPPLARIAGLPDASLLTLVQIQRQGWMSAELHATLFGLEPGDSASQLASLAHKGLLTPREDGRLEIASHLRNPVQRVLIGRGWA